MLQGDSAGEKGNLDFRDLGSLMMRIMEPGTSLSKPESLTLECPEKWDEPVKTFLKKTASASGADLRKVNSFHPMNGARLIASLG